MTKSIASFAGWLPALDLGSGVSIQDASGQAYRIVGIAEDITESKRVEAELIDSERRYRALFDDNPSMYFMVDADGIVLSVNRFGADRLRIRPQELIGSSVVAVFHPADQDAVRRNLASLSLRHGTAQALGTAQSPEGRKRDLGAGNRTGRTNEHQIPVVLIVCEDINAMKEAEMALHDSEELKNQIPAQQRRLHQGSGSGRAVTIHERRGTGTAANRTCCGIHRQALVGVLGGTIAMPPWRRSSSQVR